MVSIPEEEKQYIKTNQFMFSYPFHVGIHCNKKVDSWVSNWVDKMINITNIVCRLDNQNCGPLNLTTAKQSSKPKRDSTSATYMCDGTSH